MNLYCKAELCLHWRNKRDTCLTAVPNAPLQQSSRHVRGREMMPFKTCMASSHWHGYFQPMALWSTTLVFLDWRDTAMRVCSPASWTAKELSSQPHSNLMQLAQSLTALLINLHAHFTLHPTRERSITRDWHTKASFLFVICSLDTKSILTAASSTSVTETNHSELKIGRHLRQQDLQRRRRILI